MAAKYWEIRESYGDRMKKSPEYEEGFECGYKEGYEAAMDEMEGSMGQRSMMGQRHMMGSRYGSRDEGYEGMGERRGRDSMGRYR